MSKYAAPHIVNYYADSHLTYVRSLVAAADKTTEENLFKLALDPDKFVRTTAYYNPKTTLEAREATVFAGGILSPEEYNEHLKTYTF